MCAYGEHPQVQGWEGKRENTLWPVWVQGLRTKLIWKESLPEETHLQLTFEFEYIGTVVFKAAWM